MEPLFQVVTNGLGDIFVVEGDDPNNDDRKLVWTADDGNITAENCRRLTAGVADVINNFIIEHG